MLPHLSAHSQGKAQTSRPMFAVWISTISLWFVPAMGGYFSAQAGEEGQTQPFPVSAPTVDALHACQTPREHDQVVQEGVGDINEPRRLSSRQQLPASPPDAATYGWMSVPTSGNASFAEQLSDEDEFGHCMQATRHLK